MALVATSFNPEANAEKSKAFVEDYKSVIGHYPTYVEPQGVFGMSLLKEALKAVEPTEDGLKAADLVVVLENATVEAPTPAIAVTEATGLIGHSVLPHVFLPVHAQLAGAYKAIEAVEIIPPECGACPMFDLLERPASIEGGMLTIDEEPGAGLALDWAQVEKFAVKTYHCQ